MHSILRHGCTTRSLSTHKHTHNTEPYTHVTQHSYLRYTATYTTSTIGRNSTHMVGTVHTRKGQYTYYTPTLHHTHTRRQFTPHTCIPLHIQYPSQRHRIQQIYMSIIHFTHMPCSCIPTSTQGEKKHTHTYIWKQYRDTEQYTQASTVHYTYNIHIFKDTQLLLEVRTSKNSHTQKIIPKSEKL